MKPKKKATRKPSKPSSQSPEKLPDWLLDDIPPAPPRLCTKAQLDHIAANVLEGVKDTPAWKECVRRYGKREAMRILKAALFSRHLVQGNPNN